MTLRELPRPPVLDTAILTQYMTPGADADANRTGLQALLDRIAPSGLGKGARLFIPPRWDASGDPDPIVVSRTGSAWCIDVPSDVTIEGAGRGSSIKLADSQANFARIFNVQDESNVTFRNLRIDGNAAGNDPSYEQSHCIGIFDSTDVILDDVMTENAPGDGVYVGGSTTGSNRVLTRHLVADGCGRNPLTVADVSNVWVIDADLNCTSGGQAIDSEPNLSISHTGLHIIGGRIRNTGGGAYALAVSGTNGTYPRLNTIVRGVEFGGGGIYGRFTEGLTISETFGTVGAMDFKDHTRRGKLLGNVWTSTATGIAVDFSSISSTAYAQGWTITGNTLVAASATAGWQWWSGDDLLFAENTTVGSASMGGMLKIRPSQRNMRNVHIGPNIWRTGVNGIFSESPAAFTIDGFTIGPQTFHGVTTRAIDLSTANYITGLVIGPQSYAGSATGFRVGSTTAYVMSGVPGNKAVYSVVGTPEGQITDTVGAVAYRRDGGAGTTMYVKESATGSTGWAAK